MTTDEIILHFKPNYQFVIPESEFVNFTGFVELVCFQNQDRHTADSFIYIGLVEGRPFWYREQGGIWLNDFHFIDEMAVPE